MRIRIESPKDSDGAVLSTGTRVYVLDNEQGVTELTGITGMSVDYPQGGVVTATITMYPSARNIEANAVFDLETLTAFAEHYGYTLVKTSDSPDMSGPR